LINQSLGSTCVWYSKPDTTGPSLADLKALTAEMNSGQVSTLVILGGNPVYSAPADLQFASAMAKVANTIRLGQEEDETSAAAKWHLPEAHFLETWSAARSSDGTVAIQQPLIECMYGGKTPAEMVAMIIDAKDKKAYDIVKNYWTSQWSGKDKEATWRKALHDGVIAGVKK